MSAVLKHRVFTILGTILVAFASVHIAMNISRTDFTQLIFFYALGFGGLILTVREANSKDLFWILFGALLIRLLMINVTPDLSNDFYRFIWDGEMMKMGMLPYVKTPNEVISSTPEIFQNAELRALYHGMGELSQQNYSNYPPIHELCFWMASKLGTSLSMKIMILRIMIILADIGIVLVGLSLLKLLKLPTKNILWFALNPFILLELTANLHFEGIMMFFFLVAIWLYLKDLKTISAIFFSFSILTKVLTLIFIPFFIRVKNLFSSFTYIGLVILLTLLFAYPFFMNSGIEGYQASNLLYFQKFEFNAGIYFVIRELGTLIGGFNPVAIVGPIMGLVALMLIIYWAWKHKSDELNVDFSVLLIAFFIYLLLSTTVHPWYIAVLLILSVFSRYRFPMIWSFFAFFSYYFYQEDANISTYYVLVAVEYAVVISFAYLEIKGNRLFRF